MVLAHTSAVEEVLAVGTAAAAAVVVGIVAAAGTAEELLVVGIVEAAELDHSPSSLG